MIAAGDCPVVRLLRDERIHKRSGCTPCSVVVHLDLDSSGFPNCAHEVLRLSNCRFRELQHTSLESPDDGIDYIAPALDHSFGRLIDLARFQRFTARIFYFQAGLNISSLHGAKEA